MAVLALDGCVSSSVYGMMDVFSLANQWLEENGGENARRVDAYVLTAGGGDVTGFNGLTVSGERAFWNVHGCDVAIVPAFIGDIERLPDYGRAVTWLKKRIDGGALACSVCAGAFMLAETGMLNHRPATTHWGLAEAFQRRFPRVELKPELMLVDQGDYICAGGVTAYLDLALHLVTRFCGPEAAAYCRSALLIDAPRTSQAPYAHTRFKISHGDAEVLKAQEFAEEHACEDIITSDLATASGLEMRTFNRRFKKATGLTPLQYVQQIRIDKARTMLEETAEPVEVIADAVGYTDASSFCRLFKGRTGMSPGAYRKRFGSS